jgi:hypothetical protein
MLLIAREASATVTTERRPSARNLRSVVPEHSYHTIGSSIRAGHVAPQDRAAGVGSVSIADPA